MVDIFSWQHRAKICFLLRFFSFLNCGGGFCCGNCNCNNYHSAFCCSSDRMSACCTERGEEEEAEHMLRQNPIPLNQVEAG